ncbi:LytR/AlgR family response regulator transcription factor [Ferruginibacter albus]|uniref:LytR/AlgR family response regulator transcription factor n=1 Tax=Ferruginibacter albus TaxID=2875540 RepID=UPI001CC721A1|nr:LytTR family DNA-binding domain-containing protein [Ferruginibacter albus]UAY53567.1 LytTR family DNA-binding domain-containing protein [Ferruginibacter albus]
MKIAIIEDELIMAEDLMLVLKDANKEVDVVKILSSVTEAVHFFRNNPLPDLIYSDIQLGDGYSFDIFKQVQINVPVVFCTAYNEYALQGFKNNGIDYILKPFDSQVVKDSLNKYFRLRNNFDEQKNKQQVYFEMNQQRPKSNAVLINWKDKIIPVKIKEIALLGIEQKSSYAVTFDNKRYAIAHTLEEMENICGEDFYRANRQYLINKEAVVEAEQYFARKLSIKLKINAHEDIVVSKNKVPDFLEWLKGGYY